MIKSRDVQVSDLTADGRKIRILKLIRILETRNLANIAMKINQIKNIFVKLTKS